MNGYHTEGQTTINLERPNYEQEQLNNDLIYVRSQRKGICSKLTAIDGHLYKTWLISLLPIYSWLSVYNIRRDLFGDIISGLTVAIMHIPQGIGYAMLANVPPICGIYTAFFPVLFYTIFGTSKHNSMGMFAVASIMVGNTVLIHSTDPATIPNNSTDQTITNYYTPIEVASTMGFLVGCIQLIMFLFRLGIVSSLLSDTLVSGFTTATGIHVVTSQIKDLLGLKLLRSPPIFKNINTYIQLFSCLDQINYAALTVSLTTLIILLINNEVIKPKLAKKMQFPIPIELLVIIIGTILSNFLNMEQQWNIGTIGHIPTGFPEFKLPKFELIQLIAIDSFAVAMVTYSISVSMALIIAQKFSYEIDFNQELLAIGGGNIFGSFFSCIPFATSLSRSTIQYMVGGKTQIASIFSCIGLTTILLWIGPFFETLPRSVIAAVIIVALKGPLLQVMHFFDFWKMSKIDGLLWLITFLTATFVALDIGLLVGVIMNVICLFWKGMTPYACLLGNVPNTDLYLDINKYKEVQEINNIKVYHYSGSINFATRNSFREQLLGLIDLNISKELRRIALCSEQNPLAKNKLKCLIIDFSSLTYIDTAGVAMLKQLVNDLKKLSIRIYIAGASCHVYDTMNKCNMKTSKDNNFKYFPTVHDAVCYADNKCMPISVIGNHD